MTGMEQSQMSPSGSSFNYVGVFHEALHSLGGSVVCPSVDAEAGAVVR
jgi:hypothetical protein